MNQPRFDTSGFKKVSSDKTHTILRHPQGHEIKIAHGALSSKMRKTLDNLPSVQMANGGQADDSYIKKAQTSIQSAFGDAPQPQSTPQPKQYAKGGNVMMAAGSDPSYDEKVVTGYKQATGELTPHSDSCPTCGGVISNYSNHNAEDAASYGQAQTRAAHHIAEPAPEAAPLPKTPFEEDFVNAKAQGGLVNNPKLQQAYKMADGGQMSDDQIIAEKKKVDDYNNLHMDEPQEYPQDVTVRMQKTDVTPKQKFADGGDAMPVASSPQQLGSQDGQPTGSDALQKANQQLQSMQPNAPQPSSPQAPNMQQSAAPSDDDLAPTAVSAYQQGQKGINMEQAAVQNAAKQQEMALKSKALATNDLQNQFQSQLQNLQSERDKFKQDYINGHIDPTHYMDSMDTGKRIQTGIALALGGFGSSVTGGPNPALQFLNQQIDRDIEGQKANLGKKANLLSMNMQEYGNLKDAESMTRQMMLDHAGTQVDLAAAKAQGPMAAARAAQLKAQLMQQAAPLMQQQAMRGMLMNGGGDQNGQPGQLRSEDPSLYVPFMIQDPATQKQALKEIGDSQNIANNRQTILDAFDKAKDENSILGRISHAGFTPPSILQMRAQMLPIIHDAEGRVNEFEQKTTSDLEPKPGDSDATVAAKRDALIKFMEGKSAAPTAMAHGINLQNFKSTASGRSESPQIKIVNGVKYMRGQDGKAVKVQ